MWKTVVLLNIFVETMIRFFLTIIWWTESLKEKCIWNRNLYWKMSQILLYFIYILLINVVL